jgi:hypothetical protein
MSFRTSLPSEVRQWKTTMGRTISHLIFCCYQLGRLHNHILHCSVDLQAPRTRLAALSAAALEYQPVIPDGRVRRSSFECDYCSIDGCCRLSLCMVIMQHLYLTQGPTTRQCNDVKQSRCLAVALNSSTARRSSSSNHGRPAGGQTNPTCCPAMQSMPVDSGNGGATAGGTVPTLLQPAMQEHALHRRSSSSSHRGQTAQQSMAAASEQPAKTGALIAATGNAGHTRWHGTAATMECTSQQQAARDRAQTAASLRF